MRTRLGTPQSEAAQLIILASSKGRLFKRGVARFFLIAVTLAGLSGCSSVSTLMPPPPIEVVASPHVKTYATNFPLREDPISEDGRWIDGRTAGLDWGHVATERGRAVGYAGKARYADSVALLAGNWGPNQMVEVVVDKRRVHSWPEVSMRLRSALSAHRCTGYEVSSSVKGDKAYLIIVRWNGPLADFTYLLNVSGPKYGATTGDVLKATIVGNVITAYKNGVEIGRATDDTFASGQPGFGFNEGTNGDYGITRFSASSADSK